MFLWQQLYSCHIKCICTVHVQYSVLAYARSIYNHVESELCTCTYLYCIHVLFVMTNQQVGFVKFTYHCLCGRDDILELNRVSAVKLKAFQPQQTVALSCLNISAILGRMHGSCKSSIHEPLQPLLVAGILAITFTSTDDTQVRHTNRSFANNVKKSTFL